MELCITSWGLCFLIKPACVSAKGKQIIGCQQATWTTNSCALVGWGSSGGSREVTEASQEAGQSALTEVTEASQQATQSAFTEDSDVAAMPGSNTGHKLCLKTNGNVKHSKTCGMTKRSKAGGKENQQTKAKHCKVHGSTKHSTATVVVV
jgi:hypothetical protein